MGAPGWGSDTRHRWQHAGCGDYAGPGKGLLPATEPPRANQATRLLMEGAGNNTLIRSVQKFPQPARPLVELDVTRLEGGRMRADHPQFLSKRLCPGRHLLPNMPVTNQAQSLSFNFRSGRRAPNGAFVPNSAPEV